MAIKIEKQGMEQIMGMMKLLLVKMTVWREKLDAWSTDM
jgi:hypothetical protein